MEDKLRTTDILSNQFSQSVSRGRLEGLFLPYGYVPNRHCGRFLNPYVDRGRDSIQFTLCGVPNTLVFSAVGSVLQPFLLIAPYLSLPLPKILCRHFFPNHPSPDTLYTGSCAACLSVFDNLEKEYKSPHPMNQSLPP